MTPGGSRLLLAAVTLCCSLIACSAPHPGQPVRTSAPPESPAPTVPARLRPVAAEIRSGLYPPCAQTVGLPASIVVHGHNVSTGAPEVRCLTGAGDSDSTVVYRSLCNRNAGTTVFYWASADPSTADQHVYAVRTNGPVHAVAGLTAGKVTHHALVIELIRRAVQC